MMIKINFYFSQAMVQLENSRRPESFSMDELLHWTFATRVEFVKIKGEKPILLLPDVALFQLLSGLADAKSRLIESGRTEVDMADREGAYYLTIRSRKDFVEIADGFSGSSIVIDHYDFLKAVSSFLRSAIEEVRRTFPTLALNSNYKTLESQIQKAID